MMTCCGYRLRLFTLAEETGVRRGRRANRYHHSTGYRLRRRGKRRKPGRE